MKKQIVLFSLLIVSLLVTSAFIITNAEESKILSAGSSIISSSPQTAWTLDKSHSYISFAVDHLSISETKGDFEDYSLNVKSDKPDFTDAVFNLSIKVNSINTKDTKRDEHLRGVDFFDTEKYPEIIFIGKRFAKTKENQYTVLGDLTMHGISKTITLNAKFGGIKKDPWGGTRAGIIIWGELDRYDFGLKYNSMLEAGGFAIGTKVRLNCSIELIK